MSFSNSDHSPIGSMQSMQKFTQAGQGSCRLFNEYCPCSAMYVATIIIVYPLGIGGAGIRYAMGSNAHSMVQSARSQPWLWSLRGVVMGILF